MSTSTLASKITLAAWFTAMPLLVLNAPNAGATTSLGRMDSDADGAVVTIEQQGPLVSEPVRATLTLRGDQATMLNLPAGRYTVEHRSDGPATVVTGDHMVTLAPGQRATVDLAATD